MTLEEKKLLLKDLSARLPYGVKCNHESGVIGTLAIVFSDGSVDINSSYYGSNQYNAIDCDIENIKPYLFPLSSMTEEQKNELNGLTDSIEIDSNGIMSKEEYDIYNTKPYFECVDLDDTLVIVDWLNAHHFDYRGLIGKELALDATGLNIY